MGARCCAFTQSKTDGLEPVPLTPEAARMLTRRRAEAGAGEGDLVFPNAAGNPSIDAPGRGATSSPPPSAPGCPGRLPTSCATGWPR